MKDEWDGRDKFSIAKELLNKAIDSVARSNPKVEFGLRVFGHQSERALQDCEDSKLEVPFTKNSATLREALNRIDPKGYTPIAYSLFQSAYDFDERGNTVNAIILITDGLENCDGDPCATSEVLQNKRISLKPFVIGLGLPELDQAQFDCVGTYYDARDQKTFDKALGVVVSQALDNTTVQLNLLDQLGRATETDVEITFYDAYTGAPLYNFVHSILKNGAPDTLYLDPAGKYHVTAHTTPPVTKQNIELVPGQHNIIALDAPQGDLDLFLVGNQGFTDLKCVVRDPASGEAIYVQHLNTKHRYISGTYDLELLTLPRKTIPDFSILPGQGNEVRIANPGRLLVETLERGIMSIYVTRGGRLEKIYEWEQFSGREAIELQPGEYLMVFRPSLNKKVDMTREREVVIYSGRSTTLKFAK
jgi:Ca-activated chloride channel family protein